MGSRLTKGFSLIELMVAMSLLSLVIFVGSLSYSTFISSWGKINTKINTHAQKARNLMLLRKSVSSTVSYALRNNQEKSGLLFNGSELFFTSLTASPIFENRYPSFYQLSFVPYDLDNNSGNGDLVYYELSSQNAYYFDIANEINFNRSVTLFKNVHHFQIRYFGWESYQDKSGTTENHQATKHWYTSYNAFSSGILPEAISIQFLDEKDESYVLYLSLLDASEKLIKPRKWK